MANGRKLCTTFIGLRHALLSQSNHAYRQLSHRQQTIVSQALFSTSQKHYTDSNKYMIVERDPKNDDVAILKLNRKPLNILSTKMLRELETTLEKLEKTSRGVILTSTIANIYSAGLDITDMYQRSWEDVAKFWTAVQDMWLRLYGSPLVTIAAINGHGFAGGCLLAISCDYRCMARGKHTIGLNEAKVGVVAPWWTIDTMKNIVGPRHIENAAQLGETYTADEAFKIGLVDDVCELSELLDTAKTEMYRRLKTPDHTRIPTKQIMRKEMMDKLTSKKQEDTDYFTSYITSDRCQGSFAAQMEMLAKAKAKAKPKAN